ncbi:hypothetical protein MYSTI_02753 [Myxococcus stipitatus DSM 14675]|uniref:Uncharacterized protein n=1 Tax=Myxococcus stipitatus (strain DSM 14675 / JCM 12634 / Mx s8) TaxID=1278073 RepID=L7UC77_MYXSD|nr:hypothetical protein [Myxococcus stipitatus]AGC44069.1 hypothetical protein MYSTI_02753 [Myxococcus stipitatus DSM 14675]
MSLAHAFRRVSGPSLDDCHILADRWDGKPWVEDHAESWVVQVSDGRMHALKSQVGWLTGLWRSPSGRVYVSEGGSERGGIHVSPGKDPRAPQWEFQELPLVAMGVWGVDDRFVLTWGPREDKDEEGMFRWDGRSWELIPSPGEVIQVHGVSPEFVYAVGRKGLISRWDGSRWHTVPSFTRAMLTGIHVESQDELYACGGNGMMEGSVYGWSEVVESPGMVVNVTKFRDEVLVAGAASGLLRLKGNTLEPVERSLAAMAMDSRGRLVVASPEELADSTNGRDFRRKPLSEFVALTEGVPTMW